MTEHNIAAVDRPNQNQSPLPQPLPTTQTPPAAPDAKPAGAGGIAAPPGPTFESLGLAEEIRDAIRTLGYARPMPAQAAAFAPVLEGRDVLVRSRTGTGKTAAYAMPLLQAALAGRLTGPVLILTPTRELAVQVRDDIRALSQFTLLKSTAIYGGVGFGDQEHDLRNRPDFIVATPGRFLDHLRRRTFDAKTVAAVVLDEADEMLSLGFLEDVTTILNATPKGAQMLLFSASLNEGIERLVKQYLDGHTYLDFSGDEMTVAEISHFLVEMRHDIPKPRQMLYLLLATQPSAAIIFCNRKSDTIALAKYLAKQGMGIEAISSELSQRQRERVMAALKGKTLRFMAATDLACRGIDVTGLSHVFNYTLPEDPTIYLHRVGRTGRMGHSGTAISILSGREMQTQRVIERQFHIEFKPYAMPPDETLDRLRPSQAVEYQPILRVDELPTAEPSLAGRAPRGRRRRRR